MIGTYVHTTATTSISWLAATVASTTALTGSAHVCATPASIGTIHRRTAASSIARLMVGIIVNTTAQAARQAIVPSMMIIVGPTPGG